jgi:glutaredoxin
MGKRSFNIVLYGRPGCHLCEQVEQRIRRVGEEFPLHLQIVNIESDPHLHETYMLTIPVVEIDGDEVFLSINAIVTEEELRAELAKRSS